MENASLSHSFQDIAVKPIYPECAGDIAKTHEQHAKIEGLIKRCFSSLEERNTDEAKSLIETASQEIEQMQTDIQKIKNVMAHEHPETMHSEEHTLSLEEKLAQNVKALADIKIRYFNETVEAILNRIHSFPPFDRSQEMIPTSEDLYNVYSARWEGKKYREILSELETLENAESQLPPGFSPHILEETRFKIAKAYAEKRGFLTAINIKDFQLRDEAHRIEIAKLCATRSRVTAEKIADFDIHPSHQTELIEIAKLCAQADVSLLPRYIEKFQINPENQAALIEIAKLCARTESSQLPYYIESFKINPENQTALIEIAKLCAQTAPIATALCIENFGIKKENQAALIELAELCAKDAPKELAQNIQKFHLDQDNQAELIKIAKLCAQTFPFAITSYIQNFGIRDSSVLIEIAKICIQNDEYGLEVPETIQHFLIVPDNQKVRVDLAKLCAQRNVRAVAENIQNFGITSPNDVVEIAMFCAAHDAEETLNALYSFDIEDPLAQWQICLACVMHNRTVLPKALAELERLPLQDHPASGEKIKKIEQEFVSSAPEQREQWKAWFSFIETFLQLQPTDEPQDRFLEFIKKASSYRNPQQRFELLSAWYEGSQRGAFSERQTPLSTEPIPPSQWPVTVFLALLKSKRVENTEAFLRALPKRWHDEAKALPIVLETLHLLCQGNDLTPQDITHILSVIVDGLAGKRGKDLEKTLCSQCLIIKALIDNGLSHKLKTEEMGPRELSTIFEESFQEIFPVGRDRDFLDLYKETLGIFRQTNALFVYRGALERLQEPEKTDCLEALNQFVGAVLHSTFKTERYDTTKSEHLQTVMRDADLLRKWQTGAQRPIQTTLGRGFTVVDSDDPCDLLLSGTEVTGSCQRISGDQNLNKCLLGYILNGENRIIAIKNAAGEIIARRIMRVLWNEEEQKPVLFIEKLYTVGTVPEDVQRTLDTFAKERAQELGLPLLTAEGRTDLYGHSIKCLEGRAPFAYSDGAHGVCPKSVFSIDSPRIFA